MPDFEFHISISQFFKMVEALDTSPLESLLYSIILSYSM